MTRSYEIMHKDHVAAILTGTGCCEITDEQFLPFGLFLENTAKDQDIMVNNMLNFYAWCAGRTLALDRRYAKEILNSIGASQAVTDRDRAAIALSYHCLTLTDVCWVRETGECVSFDDINLYDHHLSNAFIAVSLRGKQMTVTNTQLAKDLSTSGCYPKAWVRKSDGFWLYKDGEREAVESELLASQIARHFDLDQVYYERDEFDGQDVTTSRIFTDKHRSICTWEQFRIYAINHDIDPAEYCLKLDRKNYYRMNIIDYLVGNTDRHWANWGFLIDNETNHPIRLHPLMDFNQSFRCYETMDGANCLTSFVGRQTQKEAAIEAVQAVDFGLLTPIEKEEFIGQEQFCEQFFQRLTLLEKPAR